MKLLLILGGLFMIIFTGLVPLSRDMDEYRTQKDGDTVQVVVVRIQSCVGKKALLIFTYNGHFYSKDIGCDASDKYKKNDTLKLKHIDGSDIFLFEYENANGELIAHGLLMFLGVIFIIKGINTRTN